MQKKNCTKDNSIKVPNLRGCMIYFIINNNAHYINFKNHQAEIEDKDVEVLSIPHLLNINISPQKQPARQYRASMDGNIFSQFYNFYQSAKKISTDLKPSDQDICFIYSEYELLNQYIANYFKTAGAKVFLIIDGGAPNYAQYRINKSEKLNLKEKIKLTIYRKLPRMNQLRFIKISANIYPRMKDEEIDGICYYDNTKCARNIKSIVLRRPKQIKFKLVSNSIMFLNQPLYKIYQTPESYISGLIFILNNLSEKFEKVIFKYHPRESIEWRDKINSHVLKSYSNITIIDDQNAVEDEMSSYGPQIVASYFSSALATMADAGVEPLYLYHLIPDLARLESLKETTKSLNEIGYQFLNLFSELTPLYKSGLINTSDSKEINGNLTLRQLVNKYEYIY